jgi:hypothetical protein
MNVGAQDGEISGYAGTTIFPSFFLKIYGDVWHALKSIGIKSFRLLSIAALAEYMDAILE